MNPDTIRKLGALGLSLEQIAGVIEVMNAEADAGKEKARARWRKWKAGKTANDGKRLQTDTNVSKPLARVEDSSSNLEIAGQEDKKEEARSAPSPRAKRLPADWTIPEAWLVEAIEAGLSRSQAEAEARKMHNWSLSDRNGAKLNWLATWRNWFARALPQLRGPPQRMPRMNAVDSNIQRRIRRNESASGGQDHRDVELFPPDKPELRRLVIDAGSAMRWPVGSSDH